VRLSSVNVAIRRSRAIIVFPEIVVDVDRVAADHIRASLSETVHGASSTRLNEIYPPNIASVCTLIRACEIDGT
jgi:hypothetical protein